MRVITLLSALLLALGLASAGWFVGTSLIESRTPERIVTVKGLSEQMVRANLGFWPVRFVASGPDLETARAGLEAAEVSVREFLANQGFIADDIQVQNITVEDRYAGYNPAAVPDDTRFVLTEDLLVTTTEVDMLAEAARSVADLLRSGVVFSSDAYAAGPNFVFTGINELKGDMLIEATARAREAAQQFADASDATVGDIKSANQGVFEILPAVEIPNDRAEKQIDKKVRVVTTVTYFLVD